MIPRTVKDYLDSHQADHLASLCQLLRIPSVANVHDQPDACQAAAQCLERYLQRLGMEVQLMPVCPPGEVDRPNVFARLHVSDALPTLLIYGHYDVQPAEPLNKWTTPPFGPAVRDGKLFARGASDDKGQTFAHLMAIEAFLRTSTPLPVNIKVLLEGMEEIGSPHMAPFMEANKALLAADAVVISDSEFFAPGLPSITYALRGMAAFEVIFQGPAADLHSGLHGGVIRNPVNALARFVASLHDGHGRVTIPGFYEGVAEISEGERRAWATLPYNALAHAAGAGVKQLWSGEEPYGHLERLWARPTLDCNGIVGGYAGAGSKTIIPSQASVKFSTRLVGGQDPARIVDCIRQYVRANTPEGIDSTLLVHTASPAVELATDSPAMRAAQAALEEAFGRKPAMVRCGASIPIAGMFKTILGVDSVLMGLGLPTDNLHSPDEHLELEQLWRGSRAAAALMQALAGK